jgi:transketolase
MNYNEISKNARLEVLKMIHKAQTSHIGSNLSVIDILTVLYNHINLQDWENRDRVVLSKGWAAASLYYFLFTKGLLTQEDLDSYCEPGSAFIGLAEPVAKGIEFAGGSMGHGLPAGVGMALAAKRLNNGSKTYVIMSDGELAIGTTWESALIAAHHKLDNLTVIIDYNKWQAMGAIEDVLGVEPLADKWKAFGFEVYTINGHMFGEIDFALRGVNGGRPKVIIANTIKGKGVSFMEDKLLYHYKNISDEEYALAVKEINEHS